MFRPKIGRICVSSWKVWPRWQPLVLKRPSRSSRAPIAGSQEGESPRARAFMRGPRERGQVSPAWVRRQGGCEGVKRKDMGLPIHSFGCGPGWLRETSYGSFLWC